MAKAKSVNIGNLYFEKKGDATAFFKAMLNRYQVEEQVSDQDGIVLLAALERHPDAKEKIGVGVDYFFVRRADYGTKCFWVMRLNGTVERFSYYSCI